MTSKNEISQRRGGEEMSKKKMSQSGGIATSKNEPQQRGVLIGDVAVGEIARRSWMEKDAGRKQQCISMASKKYCDLVII